MYIIEIISISIIIITSITIVTNIVINDDHKS